jgi:RNase_H superfamily
VAEPLRSDEVLACVHRVALARGAPTPLVARDETAEMARRRARARDHRRATLAELAALHPEALRPRSVSDTMAALAEGAEIVLSPRLAPDDQGMRAASVHALVRTGRGPHYTYAPLVVKNHEVAEVAPARRLWATDLAHPRVFDAAPVEGVGARSSISMTRSALALVHANRVLAAHGHGDPLVRGAVVDRRATVWWFTLAGDTYRRFSEVAYDRLYDERRGVLVAHDRWAAGGPYPTRPYWHRDCPDCPYADHCAGELEAVDDVSLVRFTTAGHQALLRAHGVATRAALAALDPDAARGARRSDPAPDEPVEATVGRSVSHLDDLIYRARVVVGGSLLRKVEPESMGCARADVEVDVDTESYDDATYLWGALVHARVPVAPVEPGYRSFVTFDTLDADAEAELFDRFWTWLTALRDACATVGATFAAYCFWASAEDGAMDRAVSRTPDPGRRAELTAQVADLRRARPAQWIDVHDAVKDQVQTDGPVGLKQLAVAAGFSWRDPSPSGEASIAWYERATGDDPGAATRYRRRLLEYNEDDCRATYALREWLGSAARQLAHRDHAPRARTGDPVRRP